MPKNTIDTLNGYRFDMVIANEPRLDDLGSPILGDDGKPATFGQALLIAVSKDELHTVQIPFTNEGVQTLRGYCTEMIERLAPEPKEKAKRKRQVKRAE